jgi:hypothetical protein
VVLIHAENTSCNSSKAFSAGRAPSERAHFHMVIVMVIVDMVSS